MKYCTKCGAELLDEAVICPNCGCSATPPQPQKDTNGMAVAGFVCSFFFPILGWIFGGIGLSRSLKRNGKGKGLSIAAIVIATVLFILSLIVELAK